MEREKGVIEAFDIEVFDITKRNMMSMKNTKNGNKSFSEQKEMLAAYEAAKKVQKAEKEALKFAPAAVRVAVCAYCKQEGHWIKDKATKGVTCPKLLAKDEYARRKNAAGRVAAKSWQAQTSANAREGGGGGGWKTTGSSDKTKGGVRSDNRKPVVSVSNLYDFGDDEWNEVGAAKERDAAAKAALVEDAKKRQEASEAAMGMWNKPLTVVCGEEESVSDFVSESVSTGYVNCVGCGEWGCPDCN